MANLNAFPFDAIAENGVYDRSYSSDDFASFFGKFISNGIYAKIGNCLEVIANNNSMFVTVRDGAVFINGRARDWEDEQQVRLSNAHDAYDRYDLIVARLNMLERDITLHVVEGTASASPKVPEATRTADIYDLVLAQVRVKTGVTAIVQSDVTDMRSTSMCGFVSGLINQIDAESFFEQYHIAFNQEFAEYQANFEAWFETIRGVLGEDAVGELYNEFEAFKAEVNAVVPKFDLMMESKTVTFLSSGWVKDSANGYFKQTVTVEGLTELSTPVVSLNATGTKDEMIAQIAEWGKILTNQTSENKLTLIASSAITMDLSVSIRTTVDTDIDEFRTEMSELKKSVSDGKSAVASAITAKGVNTASDATFATMATNIENIKLTKTVTSGKLYLEKNAEFLGGTVSIGLTVPIKPTSIKCSIGDGNANEAEQRAWDFKLEGKRKGTTTWDVLASKRVIVPAGTVGKITDTFTVASSYYYSEFRATLFDRNRMDFGSYIIVTGEISAE